MASGSRKVIFAALAGNSLIAVTKFVAAGITGSSAMLSEGIHSLVDTGNQGLLLYGMHRAKKPADERFPFGHGKEIYFWSFVVAILIFAVGAGVSIYEGIHRVLHPQAITDPLVNYVVLSLAIVFEGFAWYMALKEFSRVKGDQAYSRAIMEAKDPTLFVVLFEDSAAMLGLFVAMIGIALSQITGLMIFDGIASIIIGLILAATAIWLAVETKSLLIGESADGEVIRGIRAILGQSAVVEHVNEVLTMHIGPEFVLLNVSVDFRDQTPAEQLEREIASLSNTIKHAYPKVKRIFIEAERKRLNQV